MGTTASALLGGLESLWGEHSPFVMGEVILLGAMGFYLVAWLLVGWDHHKAAGGPKHEPPAGYSPAALRYLWSIEDCPVGYDDGCFTTAVVGLAGKGVVTIEQNGSTFLLHDRGVGTVELLPDEEIVYNALFHDASPGSDAPRGSLTLGQSGRRLYGQVFRAAEAGLRTQLDEQLKRGEGYRTHNRWWVWIGVLISLFGAGLLNTDPTFLESGIANNVAEGAAEISSGLNVEWLVRGVLGGALALFWALVIFLLYGSFILLRRRDMEPGLGLGFLGVAFGFMLVKVTLELYTGAGFLRVAAWMLFGYVLNARGANLLKRYSRKGRMVQDYIEGLQMYTGGERKADSKFQVYAPEMSAEHHDQLLPYAVALGRAGNWSQRFESVLANRRESGTPSPGFRGDLAGPGTGSTLQVNEPFHEALNASY
ncbi:MAG: DUF2207 domain-containing protein [Roseibacillus sp.]|nr:DUF2207 domain-containing protein [Roseibacillus sp.]